MKKKQQERFVVVRRISVDAMRRLFGGLGLRKSPNSMRGGNNDPIGDLPKMK